MPTKVSCRSTSRLKVQVVLRDSMSISAERSAVKRVLPVRFLYLSLLASPNTAAATARHTSTSKPFHTPLSSGAAKPTRPVLIPQIKCPRLRTSSRVPADANDAASSTMAARPTENARIELFISTSFKILPKLTLWPRNRISVPTTEGVNHNTNGKKNTRSDIRGKSGSDWCLVVSAAQIGLLDGGVGEKVRRLSFQHEVAVLQHIAPSGELERQLRVLLHQQDGGTFLVDLP